MKARDASPYLVESLPGYSGAIGQLVCMMNYARLTTLAAVQGLSRDALDFLLDDTANSIGMLLEHMACVEVGYQANTFGWSIEDEERWQLGSDLGEQGRKSIRGNDLTYYLDRLTTIRNSTLREFARRNDDWLFDESEFWGGKPANNYFKWFHVLEDEVNHRGQIRFIVRRLPPSLSS